MNFFVMGVMIASILVAAFNLTFEKETFPEDIQMTNLSDNTQIKKDNLIEKVKKTQEEIDYWSAKLDELSKERQKVSAN